MPTVPDRLQLFTQAGQSRRGLLGAEKLHRLRLEGDHQRRQTGTARARSRQRTQNRLVAQVHAIEVADSGNAAAVGRAQVVQSPDQ